MIYLAKTNIFFCPETVALFAVPQDPNDFDSFLQVCFPEAVSAYTKNKRSRLRIKVQ